MLITLTDLENYYSADIIKQWADDNRDGTPDTAVLNAAITDCTGHVESVLKPKYPTCVPFVAATLPAEVKNILLKQVGYQLAGRRQKAAEHYELLNAQAEAQLQALCEVGACLLYPDGTSQYSEGSSQNEGELGGAWSSTRYHRRTFTDRSLRGFGPCR